MSEYDEEAQESSDDDPEQFSYKSEYTRGLFMDEHGFDFCAVEWDDITTEEQQDNGTFILQSPIPEMDDSQKRAMYLAQIDRLTDERRQMIDDYDELIDRLKADIEIL